MLLIGWAAVCKDGMPALPFVSKREKPLGFEPLGKTFYLQYSIDVPTSSPRVVFSRISPYDFSTIY